MSESIVRALKCRECGQEYAIEPTHVLHMDPNLSRAVEGYRP